MGAHAFFDLTRTRSDAEDLAPDALVRVLKNLARVSAEDDPRAYLRRIVIHESIWRLRSPWHARSRGPTRDEAAAVAVRYLEGGEYDEIAAVLGCRAFTVRSLVKRGLDQLRIQVAVELESEDHG